MRRILCWAIAIVCLAAGPAAAQGSFLEQLFGIKPPPSVKPPRKTIEPASFDIRPQKPRKVDTVALAPAGAPWAWRILRTAWSERDEKGFEEFVARIGESGCRTMHECLTSPRANPLYAASNPPGMTFYADCADLPYMLRAYYAWKNGLPFSHAGEVHPLGATTDIRYTARGNAIGARRDLVDGVLDARKALPAMVDTISSAYYRLPPDIEKGLLPDHYPVRLTRESIKPGTIIYDPNGHVAVVWKVTAEGRIHYMDTHPDNSLTRGIYGHAFTRASPGMGAGFKRWRPARLEGAVERTDGSFAGGMIVLAKDHEIADWSDEQFFGTEVPRPKHWKDARFVLQGERFEYYDFVRRRLANAGFRYDPVEEMRSMIGALCEDLRARVDAVDVAVKAGIHTRAQPARLPLNIYGTDGDWETYSTPSRDARLKTAFKELRDETARFVDLHRTAPERLAYSGSDLAGDLKATFQRETESCRIAYRASNGDERALSYADVQARLFKLSFDPHHCVERRWGATDAAELVSCADGAEKRAWYDAQQRLRNQIDRTYDVKMGFDLAQLRARQSGSGTDTPPDVDVMAVLKEE